ncbi:hypothetical protein BHE74_00050701 [Ensete ventricosum]|nr:hypothetical protein GW17_00025121 [Ensete ventricosum]RWW43616.1 hypothetical protein BHE74_00050701 [Ensete ventricosum]
MGSSQPGSIHRDKETKPGHSPNPARLLTKGNRWSRPSRPVLDGLDEGSEGGRTGPSPRPRMALRLLHLPAKSGRSGSTVALPLEVGSRVMCQWRDQKPHPGTVIERRKIPNDYEYYVHYAECKPVFSSFLLSPCSHPYFFPVNRRLDEWVKLEQHDLGTVETGLDEKVDDKVVFHISFVTSLKMTRHQKQKIDETHVEVLLHQKRLLAI